MSQSAERIAGEAARSGFEMVPRFRNGTSTVVRWRLRCTHPGCSTEAEKGWDVTSVENMVSNMRRAGWVVGDGIAPRCPDHAHARGRSMRHEAAPSPPKAAEPAAPVAAQIGPSPKLARKIYEALDTYFDEDSRRYKPGWDDARIAKEIAVSPEIVARIRREAYGELSEDPAISALRADIASVRSLLKELEGRLEKLAGPQRR